MPVVLQGDLKYLSHVQQQEQGPSQSLGKRPYGKLVQRFISLFSYLII
jgi:hypothetical protein